MKSTSNEKKDAEREYHKRYYQLHKKEYREYGKKYREKSPDEYREGTKLRQRKYRARHPELAQKNRLTKKNENLRAKYGISLENYENLVIKQKGQCAICGKIKKLVIDHQHNGTPNVRGLLCINCNVGLGMFCDDSAFLQSATDYIETTT